MKRIMPFEKPFGMKDWLPGIYKKRKELETSIETIITSYGYEYLETPTLEYYETVGKSSAIKESELFKLLDDEGNTVVLRPDMTTPIARLISTYYKNEENPLRVAYSANVFRTVGRAKKSEFRQIGIECIGNASIDAQAEVISLLATIFKDTWKKDFQIIIGHVALLDMCLQAYINDDKDRKKLVQALNENNFIEFERTINQLSISDVSKKQLYEILQLKGTLPAVITKLKMHNGEQVQQYIQQLEELVMLLELYEVDSYITFDLSFVPHISYYTGIVFEVYGEGIGEVLAGGGQYNRLYDQFDKDIAAIGFGITLDALLESFNESEQISDVLAILYKKEDIKQALQLAKEYRKQNKKVCLQAFETIDSVEVYKNNYQNIVIIKKEEEVQQ